MIKMVLNKKSLYILSLFFSLNKFSYSDLEKILNIKKRSIDNNIKIINDFLMLHNIDGIDKCNNFFSLKRNSIDRIKAILQFAPLSVPERKEYLLLQLLFENTINLNNNTHAIDTTRRTLNYDLISLKSYLNKQNLSIESIPGKGIFLEGDEIVIRNLFSIHLSKYLIYENTNHTLFHELINSYCTKKEIDVKKVELLALLKSIMVQLIPEDFYRVLSIMLIHILRADKVIFEGEYKTPVGIKNHKFYEKTLKFLKKRGLKNLKLYELDSIIEILFLLDPKSYETSDRDTTIFIERIEADFNIDLSQNLSTVMRISNILRVAKLKIQYDFSEGKEIYELNPLQKLDFKKIAAIISSMFKGFYYEDVLSLLLVLKNHISSSNVTKNSYKRLVVVDDTFDGMYSSILSQYLKKYPFIEIVKNIKSYEIGELLEDVFEIDYIITVHDLLDFNLDTPLIKINKEYFLDSSFQLSGLQSILK
ncbi:MAG: hypothetical protein ACRC4X_01430 [Cetobacterium sp.]